MKRTIEISTPLDGGKVFEVGTIPSAPNRAFVTIEGKRIFENISGGDLKRLADFFAECARWYSGERGR